VLFKVVTTEKQFDINVDELPLKQGTLPEAGATPIGFFSELSSRGAEQSPLFAQGPARGPSGEVTARPPALARPNSSGLSNSRRAPATTMTGCGRGRGADLTDFACSNLQFLLRFLTEAQHNRPKVHARQ
jgi:hypothetical protein